MLYSQSDFTGVEEGGEAKLGEIKCCSLRSLKQTEEGKEWELAN